MCAYWRPDLSCISVSAAGTTKGGGVASTIKCGPEVFTQSRFDGALFGVCAHVGFVICQKRDPETLVQHREGLWGRGHFSA